MSPKLQSSLQNFNSKYFYFQLLFLCWLNWWANRTSLTQGKAFLDLFIAGRKKAYRKDFIKTALLYKAVSFYKVTATIAEQVRRDENILSCKHSTDFLICNGTKRSPQTTIKEKASFYATVTSKSFYVQWCG